MYLGDLLWQDLRSCLAQLHPGVSDPRMMNENLVSVIDKIGEGVETLPLLATNHRDLVPDSFKSRTISRRR
jgi:hypothetical protein